jgi:AhpD family alkylhydroperoxidase
MIRKNIFVRHSVAAAVTGLSMLVAVPAFAADAMITITPSDVMKEAQAMLGGVPTFVHQIPKAALPGFWVEERDLEFSDKTALDAKTKALISLAVAAQIPCQYCIWSDTLTLKQLGASDEEIGEAVAMAGLTRNASTLFNGLQVDFEQFKKDLGGSK